MPDTKNCDDVDEPMQRTPASAEASHHGVGGGGRKGNQQKQPRDAKRDIGPFQDVFTDGSQVQALINKCVAESISFCISSAINSRIVFLE